MCVDSQGDLVFVKVVHRVEVLQEKSTDEVHGALIILVQVSLVNNKEASVLTSWL
jgi:hypothetical protein